MYFEEAPSDIQGFILWMNKKYSDNSIEGDDSLEEAIGWMATWGDTEDGQEFWDNLHSLLQDGEDIDFDSIRNCQEYQKFKPKEPAIPFKVGHIKAVRKFIDGNT